MPWSRCIGSTTKPTTVLYDSGTFESPFDNPGSYTQSGSTVVAATLQTSSIAILSVDSNVTVIGTTSSVNLTNFTTIKVAAYRLDASTNRHVQLEVRTSKDLTLSVVKYVRIVPSATLTVYEIDVSDLSGNYYLVFRTTAGSSDKMTVHINKLWLE